MISDYAWALFREFLDEMKKQSENGSVWVNHHGLDSKENSEIKSALFGEGMLFDHLSIDKSNINAVQQYEWRIEGDEYEKCKVLGASEYVTSPKFTYNVDTERTIRFHFNFYGQMIFADKEYCGLFVEIEEMPENLKAFNIEVDIRCNDKKAYRHLMRDQKLTQKKRISGFRIFKASELNKNESFEWIFGVKIFNLKKMEIHDLETVFDCEDAELDGMYQRLSDLY